MEYRSLPSVRRYVLLEQAAPLATVITRSDNGWNIEVLGADGTLSMPEIGVEITMAELYEGLEFTTLEQ